jgi:hypothetical protein
VKLVPALKRWAILATSLRGCFQTISFRLESDTYDFADDRGPTTNDRIAND